MVFIERVLDLFFALATLLAVLVFMTDGREVAVVQGASVDFRSIATGMALGAVLPAVIGLVWMSLAPQSCLAFSLRILGGMLRLLPKAKGEGIRKRLEGLAVSFVDGFAAMRQPGRLLRILLLTGVTWALTGFLYVGLAYGFEGLGGEVGWTEGMAILVITMLGTAIPSLPGFAGVYEGAVMAAFVLLGLGSQPEVQGLAFGLVVHWVTYAAQSTTAFYFFFRDGVRVRELWAQIRRSQTA